MNTRLFLICAAALALAACATSYSPSGLAPGTTEADAIQALGPSTGQSPLRGGGKRLEFARGPYGQHTFMLDFDAQGRMLRWEQVLTVENFAKIQVDMDRREVLATIGRPSDVRDYGLREKRQAWFYRFESPICDWFRVDMTLEGKVIGTGYYEDPRCGRERR